MSQSIGSWKLGQAQIVITTQGDGYQLTLTLAEQSVAVSNISKDELLEFSRLTQTLQPIETPFERWDGQSGG